MNCLNQTYLFFIRHKTLNYVTFESIAKGTKPILMKKLTKLFLIILLIISTISYGQFTDVINSNHPGESMGAFSVGKTVIQAELGCYGFNEKQTVLGLPKYDVSGLESNLSLRYGAFLEQLEFVANIDYFNEKYNENFIIDSRNGLKKISFGAKYLLYDPNKNFKEKPDLYSWKKNHSFNYRQFIPSIGVYLGINYNFSTAVFTRPFIPEESRVSPKLMLLTQNQFGKFALTTNIIADKIGTKNQSFDYVITLTQGFNSRWTGFIENQGLKSTYYSDLFFRCGAAFLMKQNIQIDASIATNYKNSPSIIIGGLGFSWRFDKNYNEVLLKNLKEKKQEKKKGKKSKQEKKKEKEKKRIDSFEIDK